MHAYFEGLPVALSWAIDAVSLRYQSLGGDVAEVSALLARALAGDSDSMDATDAREWLSDIVPGLEFFAH